MKEFFIGLILGAVLSLATAWYFIRGRHQPDIRKAQDLAAARVTETWDAIDAKLTAWHLTTPEVKAEIARTGKVVRRSVSNFSEQAAHATHDATLTGRVKAKLIADKQLSGWDIAVSTTAGIVTLSGLVPDHAHIARATALALDTEGVREVHSTLQVKK